MSDLIPHRSDWQKRSRNLSEKFLASNARARWQPAMFGCASVSRSIWQNSFRIILLILILCVIFLLSSCARQFNHWWMKSSLLTRRGMPRSEGFKILAEDEVQREGYKRSTGIC